jgi:hypothetical protein
MSGRLLDFKSYVGGADNVVVEEVFPSESNEYAYNYGGDVSTYTFAATYQTLVADVVAYDRNTGLPNFTETKIIGFFGSSSTIPSANIDDSDAVNGIIKFNIPGGLYTGPITPSARTNESIVTSHRWCLMQRWDSTVSPADPTIDSNYIPLGTGGVLTFTDNSATDADRAVGAYTVTGLSNKEGTGAQFSVQVTDGGVTNIDIISRGAGYNVGDTIQLLDVNMGGGGAADITVTVSTVA